MVTFDDFDEYGKWYCARLKRRTGRSPSPATGRTRKYHLLSVCKEAGFQDLETLATTLADRRTAELLVDTLTARRSSGTANGMVYSLVSFGEYAVLKGWIPKLELSSKDAPPKNPPKPITVYSPDDMERFVSAARGKDLRWWAFITFMVDTGRRVGEALSLEWDWFRMDSTPAYIELPISKNGDPQYVPLSRRLQHEVFTSENIVRLQVEPFGRAMRRSRLVYPFPWSYATVKARLELFCHRAGLPDRGFHNIRHTVITERIARGVPIQAVASLAGHSSPAVTLSRYSHATALDYARFIDVDEE